MIISLRGTSGAGKTTLARKLIDIPHAEKVMQSNRRNPIAYVCTKAVLLGSYETTCGGCDTIHSMDEIFENASFWAGRGHNVVMEGLLLSEEVNRTVALSRAYDVRVFVLDTPVGKCLENINERRRRKDIEAEPVNPKNTTNRHATILRAKGRLLSAGVWVREAPFNTILKHVRELIK